MSKTELVRLHVIRVVSTFLFTLLLAIFFSNTGAFAQTSDAAGSRNVAVVGHVAASAGQMGNLVLDQSPDRPYLYTSYQGASSGFNTYDLTDPGNPSLLHRSEWPTSDSRPTDISYFQHDERTYVIVGSDVDAHAGAQDGAPDVSAIIYDVSALRGDGSVTTVSQLSAPDGFQTIFAYRHSGGSSLLFATGGTSLFVYDLEAVLSGNQSPSAVMEIPERVANVDYGFHSMYVAYHPETETDRLYTGAAGGYFVYDITDVDNPSLLASVNSAAVQVGHTIIPTPDGNLAVTTTGYPTAPIRIFDLEPILDGIIPRARTALGAWVANWKNYSEHFAVRWPFVFVAGMQDGFQAFNMMFPVDPYTVGFYRTSDVPQSVGSSTDTHPVGAWDIDVRNSDGMIAVSDLESGLWLFQMEGFEGWDGRGWGLPNVSNAQDWSNGPVNAMEWPVLENE